MKITSEEMLNVSFSGSLLGYDRKEVDEFLDAAAEEMRNLEHEKEEMIAALDSLMKEIERRNTKAESEEKQEKEPVSTKKAPVQHEKKASAEKQSGSGTTAKAEKTTKEEPLPDQDEKKEPVAPSRHILRGTGERNKRSLPSFLHPHPIESQDVRNEPEKQKTAEDETENGSSGLYLKEEKTAHTEIRTVGTEAALQDDAETAPAENGPESTDSTAKDGDPEESR